MQARRGAGGYGRTAGTALAAAGVVLVALLGAPTARAAGTAEGQAAPYIDAGQSSASASVLSIAPTAGSLAFAIESGRALAKTSGALAESLSQSFDLGLIGTSLTAEGCDGGDALVATEQLPQPTQADNRSGSVDRDSTEIPLLGGQLGVGREQAIATVQPSSHAITTSLNVGLGPLLTIRGGTAEAMAEAAAGEGRTASATVDVSIDIAGIVQITGLRWHASHHTGDAGQTSAETDAGFTIDALEILGLPVPVEAVDAVATVVNQALAAIGLRIELPHIERLDEPVQLVRVTPFRVLVIDSPLGVAGVRPALELTRQLRSDLFEAITGLYCPTASVLLLGEIGVGIASGTGALLVSIGGVEARSSDIVYEDPFGTGVPPTVDTPARPESPTVAATPANPRLVTPLPSQPTTVATAPVVAPGGPVATERSCESTHPERSSGCSRGSAGVVGGIGLAATALVGVFDYRRRRSSLALAAAAAAVSAASSVPSAPDAPSGPAAS